MVQTVNPKEDSIRFIRETYRQLIANTIDFGTFFCEDQYRLPGGRWKEI